MISMANNHYTPMFNSISSDPRVYLGTNYPDQQRIQTSGIETIASGSQYALQHAQSMGMPAHQHAMHSFKSPPKPRRYTYEQPQGIRKDARQRSLSIVNDTKGSNAPIRRRISRACDQCNQLRTKCDGMNPCSHCVDFSLSCEYFRERKKRGKASRKDIAQQQAAVAAAAAASSTGPSSPTYSASASPKQLSESTRADNSRVSPPRPSPAPRTMSSSENLLSQQQDSASHNLSRANSMGVLPDHLQYSQSQQMNQVSDAQRPGGRRSDTPGSMHSYVLAQDYNSQPMAPVTMDDNRGSMHAPVMQLSQSIESGSNYHYMDNAFDLIASHETHGVEVYPFSRPAENSIPSYIPTPPMTGSESWFPIPSPSNGQFTTNAFANSSMLRYPVLQPLMPKLVGFLPAALACELLELYFTSSYSTHNHPLSPYILGYVFRRRSFLHPTRPRKCSSALLASMLWVAAQTSDAPFLTSSPAARGKICQKLLELTISLLRPLIHGPAGDKAPNYNINTNISNVPAGGFGVLANDEELALGNGCTGSGSLDDVATYLHFATVVSASEHKAASLRWWNAAWSLARELKLGRELPPDMGPRGAGHGENEDTNGDIDLELSERNRMGDRARSGSLKSSQPDTYSEEEREERRRMWWLLYTVDRHLALCYNRPLFLLDVECIDLLQPVDDIVWQAGEFYTGGTSLYSDSQASQPPRRRGPSFECTSHSIFGFFTPLMTILGEIVELNQARKHPTLGVAARSASEWDDQTAEITRQLEEYGRSLKQFEARCNASLRAEQQEAERARSVASGPPRMTENIIQTKKVVAYGTHVMNVLHILMTGKWDPISLLEDSDLWITSQSFIHATQRAVSAAEAISEILEYDPDLSFMPFFFGIYLLQGSFILLLIADRLQTEASQSVVSACEAVVRAVEACVVTLNTEYQRNFRKVLRSALAQVKGHIPEDFGEQQQRRREVLALYRWTGDGTGLAL